MDVIKKYCVSESCNQIGLSNGSVEYILKIPTDYYTFNGFCEAVQETINEYVHIGQISYKDEYIGFSIVNTAEEW